MATSTPRITAALLAALFMALALMLAATTNAERATGQATPNKTGFNSSCQLSHVSEQDPIFEPAAGHGHTHYFFGNLRTNNDSTGANLQNTGTNCTRVGQKSAYWAPQLRWGGREIEPSRTGVYYQTADGLDHAATKDITFGMEALARAEDGPGRVLWYCGVTNQSDGVETAPNRCENPAAGLGVSVFFPECFDPNGPRTGGWDLADASQRSDGSRFCASHHPRQIPTLVMHIDYPELPQVAGPVTVQTDDGYGSFRKMHADYVNSEDVTDLVRDCIVNRTAGDNRPTKCEQ